MVAGLAGGGMYSRYSIALRTSKQSLMRSFCFAFVMATTLTLFGIHPFLSLPMSLFPKWKKLKNFMKLKNLIENSMSLRYNG